MNSNLIALVLGLFGLGLAAISVIRHFDQPTTNPPTTERKQTVTPMAAPSNPFQSWNDKGALAMQPVELPKIEPIEALIELEADHHHEDGFEIPALEVSKPLFLSQRNRFNEASEVERLLSRLDQAAMESVLHEHRNEIQEAIKNAEVVERIHNVTFNTSNPHLDHRDETYLVSALQNSAAMRAFKDHPDANLLIFGYASKDGSPRNKFYALNRAQSTEHAVDEHRNIVGFKGKTKSWCVGETDILSKETDEHCSQHNRAAEIWMVVSDSDIFDDIESDQFLETIIRESGHGHKGEHH